MYLWQFLSLKYMLAIFITFAPPLLIIIMQKDRSSSILCFFLKSGKKKSLLRNLINVSNSCSKFTTKEAICFFAWALNSTSKLCFRIIKKQKHKKQHHSFDDFYLKSLNHFIILYDYICVHAYIYFIFMRGVLFSTARLKLLAINQEFTSGAW